MYVRLSVLLLFAAALSGCGTRSIIVPVTRPALIDVHRCPVVLIASCDVSYARVGSTTHHEHEAVAPPEFSAAAFAEEIDTALPPALASTGQAEWITGPEFSGRDLLRTSGKVSNDAVQQLRRKYDANCVLVVSLLEARYDESMLTATIQSTVTPGSEKRVRQARASLVVEVLLIDAIEGRVEFADSIRTECSRETHASDAEPAEINIADMQRMLVSQLVLRIAESTQPLRDREVVTFLLNSDVPAIAHAIELAELGRWPAAAAVLDSAAAQLETRGGADIVWYNLGPARQYAGNFSGALAAFETARQLRDSGRYRAAIERLLRAEEEYLEQSRQGL